MIKTEQTASPIVTATETEKPRGEVMSTSRFPAQGWGQIWESLVRLGLGELALRVGTGLASIALILLVIWVMGSFYLKGQTPAAQQAVMAAALPTATPNVAVAAPKIPETVAYYPGITRLANLHTTLPARSRFEVTQYEVVKGDSLYVIAEKFNLNPESLLWANYAVLKDNVHSLRPGQKLNILPVNGLLYEWHAGDGLNGVAKFYKVKVDDIINWPGNKLDATTLGDLANPNIAAGTQIIIPGGKRETVTWSAPRITRANPAVAKILGPGSCGTVGDGPVGNGTFVWPTPGHYTGGGNPFHASIHPAIDIAGATGNSIFSTDNGVVVYSGWNDWGYGNLVVVDHGNGWQTLYAHLSVINAGCGAYVYQGGTLGFMGSTGNSTGPHLHFEMRHDAYGKVNPLNFLK